MKTISSTAKIDAISFKNQAGHDVAPTSGSSRVYATTSGLYVMSSGLETPVLMTGSGKRQGTAYCMKTNIQAVTSAYPRLRFDNVQVDPDSTITTGTSWKFTAPYDCYATIYLQAAMAYGKETIIRHYVNDVLKFYSFTGYVGTWGSHRTGVTFKMSSGDYYYSRYGHDTIFSWNTVNWWCRFSVNYIEQ